MWFVFCVWFFYHVFIRVLCVFFLFFVFSVCFFCAIFFCIIWSYKTYLSSFFSFSFTLLFPLCKSIDMFVLLSACLSFCLSNYICVTATIKHFSSIQHPLYSICCLSGILLHPANKITHPFNHSTFLIDLFIQLILLINLFIALLKHIYTVYHHYDTQKTYH